MPLRGSAQLLLLFFRSRAGLGWLLGAIGGVLIAAALLLAGGAFSIVTRTGLAQLIRQSAWQHALAGMPEQAWPWADTAPAPEANVPRLGLSAAIGKGDSSDNGEGTVIEPIERATGRPKPELRTKLGEVGVGDRITVTAADGTSHVYRVTGAKVVDPYLWESDSAKYDVDPTLVTCLPLDPLLASSLRLIIQATNVDPPAPPAPKPQQKL
jgi:hypothetical protein